LAVQKGNWFLKLPRAGERGGVFGASAHVRHVRVSDLQVISIPCYHLVDTNYFSPSIRRTLCMANTRPRRAKN
jgi:hypothetical protein